MILLLFCCILLKQLNIIPYKTFNYYYEIENEQDLI